MPEPSLNYAVGRLRVREVSLLGRDDIERLIEAEDIGAAMRILSQWGWSAPPGSAEHDFNAVLHAEQQRLKAFIDEISPERALTDCLYLQHDFHNLKVLIKCRLLGRKPPKEALSDLGTVPAEAIIAALESGDAGALPESLAAAAAQGEGEGDPFLIDARLDRAYFQAVFDRLKARPDAEFRRYFGMLSDFADLRALLRVRRRDLGAYTLSQALLGFGELDPKRMAEVYEMPPDQWPRAFGQTPYAAEMSAGIADWQRTGATARLDKLLDDKRMSIARARRWELFTTAPLLGYYLARQGEFAAVRQVLSALSVGLPRAELRERLREMYAA